MPTSWGQVDYFTYSYCSAGDYKMIDHNLYNEIPETDTRKQWFHPSVLISWYKFMMPEEKQWETVHGQMILFTCELKRCT